jgi:hypothetical protein
MTQARTPIAALSIAALLGTTGCFKSYVAVSFRPPVELGAEASASGTPALAQARSALKTVAVRAPSGCTSSEAEVSPAGAGVALRSRAILESRCESWLGELERALGTRYKVVGWRDLARHDRLRSAGGERTGADLIFQVRDLVVEPLLVASTDPRAVVLTRATPRAEARPGAKPLSPKAEQTIRRIVGARFPDGAVAGMRATIEIDAVPSSGGDPLWTYRGRVSDGLSGALEPRMLLRGRSRSWRPVAPRGWAPEDPGAAGATAASPVDPVQARLRELAAAVADDVVARFTTEP